MTETNYHLYTKKNKSNYPKLYLEEDDKITLPLTVKKLYVMEHNNIGFFDTLPESLEELYTNSIIENLSNLPNNLKKLSFIIKSSSQIKLLPKELTHLEIVIDEQELEDENENLKFDFSKTKLTHLQIVGDDFDCEIKYPKNLEYLGTHLPIKKLPTKINELKLFGKENYLLLSKSKLKHLILYLGDLICDFISEFFPKDLEKLTIINDNCSCSVNFNCENKELNIFDYNNHINITRKLPNTVKEVNLDIGIENPINTLREPFSQVIYKIKKF